MNSIVDQSNKQPFVNIVILEPDMELRTQFIRRYSHMRQGIKVCFCASIVAEFLSRYQPGEADLLILSIYNHGINGIEILEEIRNGDNDVKILATSEWYQPWLVNHLTQMGVEGYCQNTVDEMIRAVESLERKCHYYWDGDQDKKKSSNKAQKISQLSTMEIKIIELTSKGLKNKEIAAELSISKRTVDTYIGRILLKLGLKRKSRLLDVASKLGLHKKND
ncbi:response regulator transcription factor [Anditalea andensis]|uniref:HTH luxR-type domain-containing protein n=1 Tax=Anditalea andensis TaxID=1048983 RepID=A0A074KVU1_9BACT|nr:response regulator transcription factor [Anditalea andensis]KEO73054.1 hypothetical protein EL17_15700 [Anditalea andensis]